MNTTEETIGGNVKRYRLLKRLKAVELAKLSGMSKAYLSQIESNSNNNITTCILCDLCRALEITPNDLIPEHNYKG